MAKNINPIVEEVLNRYSTITEQVKVFVNNPTAVMRGLLISGNAGGGKTHAVLKGLQDVDESRVDYIKGSSVTAPVMYCKLYQNRHKDSIMVIDDVDIIHKSKVEMNDILNLFKGATEPTIGSRILEWGRANPNQLMKENDIPSKFDFQGSIIWITNDSIEQIADRAKGSWNAISSRFRQVPVWLNDQEKVMYTIHLIEEVGMLGKNCQAKKGGFDKSTIVKTCEYIRTNYRSMLDVTPRQAIAIADTIDNFPKDWQKYCEYQFLDR